MSEEEIFFVADRMIKVTGFEAVAANTFKFGSDVRQAVVFVTFQGYVNNTGDTEREAVTVGLAPPDVLSLIKLLRESYLAVPLEER